MPQAAEDNAVNHGRGNNRIWSLYCAVALFIPFFEGTNFVCAQGNKLALWHSKVTSANDLRLNAWVVGAFGAGLKGFS